MGNHKESKAEPETNLFSKLPAECLVMDAGWILKIVAVHLSCQEDAQLHHLLQHSGCRRQHSNVIVQLNHEEEIQIICNLYAYSNNSTKHSRCVGVFMCTHSTLLHLWDNGGCFLHCICFSYRAVTLMCTKQNKKEVVS